MPSATPRCSCRATRRRTFRCRVRWRCNTPTCCSSANHHAQAIAYLRDQLALSRTDPDYYNFLATSYAALDKKTLQHQATAELYLLLGSTPAAVEQLQLARKVADADFYTMTEVDARLRQLTERAREEREEAKAGGH